MGNGDICVNNCLNDQNYSLDRVGQRPMRVRPEHGDVKIGFARMSSINEFVSCKTTVASRLDNVLPQTCHRFGGGAARTSM